MRLPAEWEKQGFVQLTWPHEDTAWYALPQVLDCYVAVAKAITRYEPLLVVCRDKAECLSDMAARGWEPAANVRFVECPLNDTWARDHGAISVWGNEGEKCIEDFVFNGWGLKFGADLDNQITRTIYKAGALPSTRPALSRPMSAIWICALLYWKAAASTQMVPVRSWPPASACAH